MIEGEIASDEGRFDRGVLEEPIAEVAVVNVEGRELRELRRVGAEGGNDVLGAMVEAEPADTAAIREDGVPKDGDAVEDVMPLDARNEPDRARDRRLREANGGPSVRSDGDVDVEMDGPRGRAV